MPSQLQPFIKEALVAGESRQRIRQVLLDAGWRQGEIDSGLSDFAESDFPIPVPRRRPYLSAREAFLYLLLFLCLYISAFSFGKLVFEFISRWVPDVLEPYYGPGAGLRQSVASLIVAFPVYLWLTSITEKAVAKEPDRAESRIRKWLTYMTLFVAAGVIITDLIVLLFNLLEGELTLRFLLKVLTVLLIAALIFGYYLWSLRQTEKEG